MDDRTLRIDWTRAETAALFDRPFMDLLWQGPQVHRRHHAPNEVQLSTLLSIKAGGCPEDCGYCSQSAYTRIGPKVERLVDVNAGLLAMTGGEPARAAAE